MNMNKLASDLKIKKGDFITVVEWKSHVDNSYKGDCLEVKVVDLPFLRVERHDGVFPGMLTLSLDAVEVMPLSKDFVDSVLEEKKNREDRISERKAKA